MSYTPTLDVYNRQRQRVRKRLVVQSIPNYVTVKRGGYVYSLTFSKTPFISPDYEIYKEPYPHAYGYVDNPTPNPPYKLVGPSGLSLSDPPAAISDAIANAITPLPITEVIPFPTNPILSPQLAVGGILPSTSVPQTAQKPFTGGISNNFVPGQKPSRIVTISTPARHILIVADSANTGNIWVGFNAGIATGKAFKLVAGAANDFDIDDIAKVYFLAENGTDQIFYEYFT